MLHPIASAKCGFRVSSPVGGRGFVVALGVIWAGWLALAAADPPPADPATARQAEMDRCVGTLGSEAPHEQKLAACRQLARIGDATVIPALAPLLADDALSHPARLALEAIADPAAGEALRAALPQAQGQTLAGIVLSLGARGEASAVANLVPLLSHADLSVASAAATALGMIDTPEASAALIPVLGAERAELRAPAACGLLRLAATRQAQGDPTGAARLCDAVRSADLAMYLRAAGLRGAILASADGGAALLGESLRSSETAFFSAALEVSRELTAAPATAAMTAALSELPPERQALVLVALGDRGDTTAREAVMQAARSEAPAVRVAALGALGQLGDGSAIAVLLAAAADPQAEVSAAARDGLTALTGETVDTAVVAAFGDAAGAMRPFLVELIGRRRITAAVPQLLPLADDADPALRQAVWTALGRTIGPEHLGELTRRLLAAKEAGEAEALQQALTAACLRMVDRNATATVVADAMGQAAGPTRIFLLELLGKLGGPNALEAAVAEAGSSDAAMQDAATRVLGKWPTPDAAPQLLELVRAGLPAKYKQRVLHGLVRIVRQMDMTNDARLALLREAMQAAERDEERCLAVEALGRIPTREALSEAVSHLGQPALRAAACAAAVSTAEALVAADPAAVAEPMKQVVAAATDAEVVRRAKAVLAASAKP